MLDGKPQLEEVYLSVQRDILRHHCKQLEELDDGHVVVLLGCEIDGFEFGGLIAVTDAAAYYLVKRSGTECVLGIVRRGRFGGTAFYIYDAAYLLFSAVTTNLLPFLDNFVGTAFSGRVYPRFDLSLRQIIRKRPLALRHINVYLQQLARFLQIGEQLDYSLGIFRSDMLFLSSSVPGTLIVPELGNMRKKAEKCDGYLQHASIEGDAFQLGALLFEMATAQRLLDHIHGEHSAMKQMLQLFGKQSTLAWMPQSFTVEASENYFNKYSRQLRQLSFSRSDRLLPRAEILLSPSPYDETADRCFADRIVNTQPYLPGNSAPAFADFTRLLERLLLISSEPKYAFVLEYLSAQSLDKVVEEDRLEHD